MEYRKLGRTDLEVSVIGFGLIGARGVDALRAMLEEGLRLGINHVDTARSYGRSEEMLGKAFSNRDDFYITSRTESRDYENAEKDLQTSLEMGVRLILRDIFRKMALNKKCPELLPTIAQD